MKKKSQLGFSIIFVLLAAILMISVYTVVLQRSYGCIAEEAAVARDTKCADVIHQTDEKMMRLRERIHRIDPE